MAEDPRPFLHFKTFAKFQQKLADGTINPNKHFVVIKDEGLVWIRGKMLIDNGRLKDLNSYYNDWELTQNSVDNVVITLKGKEWEWTEYDSDNNPLKGHWITISKPLTLKKATGTIAGLMSAQDKRQVDIIDTANFKLEDPTTTASTVTIHASHTDVNGETRNQKTSKILQSANAENAGILTAEDKRQLDIIKTANFELTAPTTTTTNVILHTKRTDVNAETNNVADTETASVRTLPAVTESKAGVMIAEDKKAINNIKKLGSVSHIDDENPFTRTATDVTLNYHCKSTSGDSSENSASHNPGIGAATSTNAGLMTADDRVEFERIETTNFTLGNVTPATTTVEIAASKLNIDTNATVANNITLPESTTIKAGVMSNTDKIATTNLKTAEDVVTELNNYTRTANTVTTNYKDISAKTKDAVETAKTVTFPMASNTLAGAMDNTDKIVTNNAETGKTIITELNDYTRTATSVTDNYKNISTTSADAKVTSKTRTVPMATTTLAGMMDNTDKIVTDNLETAESDVTKINDFTRTANTVTLNYKDISTNTANSVETEQTIVVPMATIELAGCADNTDKIVSKNLQKLNAVTHLKDSSLFNRKSKTELNIEYECVSTLDKNSNKSSHSITIPLADDTHAGIIDGNEHKAINTDLPNEDAAIRKEIQDLIKGILVSEKTSAADAITSLASRKEGFRTFAEVAKKLEDFLTIENDTDTVINKWKDIESFLEGIEDTSTLKELLDNIKNIITGLDKTNSITENTVLSSLSQTDGQLAYNTRNLSATKLAGYIKASSKPTSIDIKATDTLGTALSKLEWQSDKARTVVNDKTTGHVTVATTNDATNDHYIVTISENDIASDQALTNEITARKAIDGQTGQTYTKNTSTNYIKDATSLNNADIKLDTALKTEETRAKAQEDTIEAAIGLNADGTHKTTTGNYTSSATTIADEIAALDTALKTTDTNFSNRRSFKIITGDSGTATADVAEDTLKIAGGTNLTTVATDTSNNDVLTINHDAITRTDPSDSTKTVTVPSSGTSASMNKMVKSITSSTTGHVTAVQHETVSIKHGDTTRTDSTNTNDAVTIPSNGTEVKLGDKVESVTSSTTGHVTSVTTGNITVKHGDTTRTDTNTINVSSVVIPADGTATKINDAVVSITSNSQGHITAVTKNNLTVNHELVTRTDSTANNIVTAITTNNGHVTGVTSKSLSGDITTDASLVATIGTSKVTASKIASNAVETAKIADKNVTTAKLNDSAVTTAKINNSAVTTAKIADANVTTDKLSANAVTNAKLAKIPANTIKGNNTNTEAEIKDLSTDDVKTMLGLGSNAYTSTSYIPTSQKAAASGVASLDANSKLVQNIDASKITSGTISIDRLPKGALERLVIVANETERKKLTNTDVQVGDTVKETDTGLMYYVKDDSKLNQNAGWEVYTAGSAASVPWSGVTDKPNYASSSSQGGSATSAVKLDTATAGSATQPVYFTGGKPSACTYSLNKTVPSDAVFTDTNTKVTSAANHYSPTAVDGSKLTASASGATASWSIDVVKGITIERDDKGHVTNVSVESGKIPSKPTDYTLPSAKTDTLGGIKVSNVLTTSQTLTSSNGTTANRFYGVQADKDGKAFVNVPWTDNNTTYSTATSSTLGLVKSQTTGTTANRDYKVEVATDGTMKVNVPWTDNNTTYATFTGASTSADGTLGLVPKPTKGNQAKYLKADGTWDTPYTHPTTSGNKHIPSGGSAGQILEWSSDGTAKWSNLVTTLSDKVTELEGKLLVLETGSKVTTTVSPATIYKGTATNVTVTATFSASDDSLTPSSISIKQGSTDIVSASNAKTTSKVVSLNTTNNSTSYVSTAVVKGVTLTHTVNVNARYPIYYGFATSKPTSAAFSGSTKVGATTTASREYSATCSANNSHFYVLIPSDITTPTTFTMGGAPFVMNKTTATLGGISYNILESGGIYNNGAKVNVKM